MRNIQIKSSLDSKLQTFCICSVRILNILKVIAKTSFSKIAKCSILLQANGLCQFRASPEASGNWTVYFIPVYAASESDQGSDQMMEQRSANGSISSYQNLAPIQLLLKKKNGGLGLSIVAARGSGQAEFGIYIKSVVPDGAAADDGRLVSGDLLVAVDDTSLHGFTQEHSG